MPVINDTGLVKETLPMLRAAVGETNIVDAEPRMGAEDFSYFQRVVPGFYWRLGSGNKAKGITAEAHTPDFDIDEDCLVVGVKSMANVLWDLSRGIQQNNARSLPFVATINSVPNHLRVISLPKKH